MPPRPNTNRQFGGGRDRGGRSQDRGFEQRRRDFDSDFDEGPDFKVAAYVPPNNHALQSALGLSRSFDRVGMTADTIESTPDGTRLLFSDRTSVVQGDPVLSERLPRLSDLAEMPIDYTHKDNKVTLDGQFAVIVAGALVFTGGGEGEKIAVFRRPEIEAFGRGESGATGFMQQAPSREAASEIAEEYLIFAKQGSEEVLVSVDTGEAKEAQEYRLLKARERSMQAIRQQLQGAVSKRAAGQGDVAKLLARQKYLEKPRKVVLLKQKPLSAQLQGAMQTIETDLHDTRDKMEGFVSYDQQQRTVTLLRPIGVDLQASGIDPKSIEIVDGVGDREVRIIDSPSRSLAPALQELARNLGRPKLVQTEQSGYVVLPPTVENQMWSDPRTVLPLAA